MKGNCALHLAALHGHGITCWMLLKAGGPELLCTRNSDGCTAVDLAKSSTCSRLVLGLGSKNSVRIHFGDFGGGEIFIFYLF